MSALQNDPKRFERTVGVTPVSGKLNARIIRRKSAEVRATFSLIAFLELLILGLPQRGLSKEVNAYRFRNIPNLLRGVWKLALAGVLGIPTMYGRVFARVVRADGSVLDLGLVSLRVVTTAGVGFIVDAWQNILELEIMKYHGVGTGTNAEASGDTALQTESTTVLNPDSTRATGSLTEGASANIFRSVGTLTFDGSAAITEHGLFSQAATGGGTLFDRSVFSAINVASGDSIQFTYDATFTAGS